MNKPSCFGLQHSLTIHFLDIFESTAANHKHAHIISVTFTLTFNLFFSSNCRWLYFCVCVSVFSERKSQITTGARSAWRRVTSPTSAQGNASTSIAPLAPRRWSSAWSRMRRTRRCSLCKWSVAWIHSLRLFDQTQVLSEEVLAETKILRNGEKELILKGQVQG